MDRDEVRRIARLARIEVAEDRMERMAHDLSEVLDFIAALNRLDLAGLAPTVFAPAEADLRPDVLDDRRLGTERALAAAPESEDGFFLVPPVVENLNP